MSTQHKKYFDPASSPCQPASWPCQSLTPEERMLVVLRDELYGGSWERMLRDLRDRQRARPYLFKLVNRIHVDILRIEKLQRYDKKRDLNLGDSAAPTWSANPPCALRAV